MKLAEEQKATISKACYGGLDNLYGVIENIITEEHSKLVLFAIEVKDMLLCVGAYLPTPEREALAKRVSDILSPGRVEAAQEKAQNQVPPASIGTWRQRYDACPNCGVLFLKMISFANLYPHYAGYCKRTETK